jgi:hypothetical protein
MLVFENYLWRVLHVSALDSMRFLCCHDNIGDFASMLPTTRFG